MTVTVAHLILIDDTTPPTTRVYDIADKSAANIARLIEMIGAGQPVIGKIRMLVDGMNLRTGPGTNYPMSGGTLRIRSEHAVYERKTSGKSTWDRIGESQWVAEVYEGSRKADYVSN
jgi:hypothetical protein